MELIIFTGIPAAGKSSLFRERFVDTHIRINLDMLKSRHREKLLLAACVAAKQSFVVDNANLTKAERSAYLRPAKASGFRVVGYYFRSVISESLERNERRTGSARVPDAAILAAAARLEIPTRDEGYDELKYVSMNDGLRVEDWRDP